MSMRSHLIFNVDLKMLFEMYGYSVERLANSFHVRDNCSSSVSSSVYRLQVEVLTGAYLSDDGFVLPYAVVLLLQADVVQQ